MCGKIQLTYFIFLNNIALIYEHLLLWPSLVQGMRFKLSRAYALAGSNPAGSKLKFILTCNIIK